MCKIDGCNNPVHTKKSGLCSKHYNRLRTTGTTEDGPRARASIKDRFWRHSVKSSDCWEWAGPKNHYGYGVLSTGGRNGKSVLAHRYSWELHNGPLPIGDGYHGTVVRHKCDNRSCVNPEHLEIGSQKDNVADMDKRGRRVSNPRSGPEHHNGGKTHCINGHEFNDKNTYTHPKTGHRYCKVCKSDKAKAARRKERGNKFGVATYRVRTHCKHGHEFTEQNTYVRPDGYKECKTCRVERVSRFYLKKKS
jgi:hypothetical protein